MYHVTDGITRDSTVDGGWTGFDACSVACGGGTQSRTCSEPSPSNGGKDCEGDATKTCNTQACTGAGRCCECAMMFALRAFALHLEPTY